ncbi:MAG: 2-oxoacid:acceptor oxidoreductase family protein [Desulfobacterales bacterium]|nr:2-oxoacid:acceptor oxidoreductase family protein [Desulfobacterales bacterium]
MDSLLNPNRPPVFCPGCAHDRVVHSLDNTFRKMGLSGNQIVIVTDIGCSGLFDTFFETHAFHGLHGRALTYATGIKMARPDLHVVVTMGDGGLGIGGAHVLSSCRRNIDITLLVLNNFNYGMTGGQCSVTTPQNANVGSGFLNRLEKPVDICQVAGAAGAAFVSRASSYEKELEDKIEKAIRFEGFSLVDIWGICPGRYSRRNKLSPKIIEAQLSAMPKLDNFMQQNLRKEYGKAYCEHIQVKTPAPAPLKIEKRYQPPLQANEQIVFLGSAGQRIITAAELVCLAGATAGLFATQKNDYPITVMRGHSVSELILSKEQIDYTGIEKPSIIFALAQEGINRRKKIFDNLSEETLVIKAAGVEIPATGAEVEEIDFKTLKIKTQDWALASLAMIANENRGISMEMLDTAMMQRFKGSILEDSRKIVSTIAIKYK